MRVQHTEQGIRNLRKLIIDLEMNSRRKEREGLDQPLDMRVLAFIGLQQEAASYLGIGLGEFLPQLAKGR